MAVPSREGYERSDDVSNASVSGLHVVWIELGRPPDHAEDVVVDQEALAQLAVRPDPELAQPSQARLTPSTVFPRRGPDASCGTADGRWIVRLVPPMSAPILKVECDELVSAAAPADSRKTRAARQAKPPASKKGGR